VAKFFEQLMGIVGGKPREPVEAPEKADSARAPAAKVAYEEAPTRPYRAPATRVNAKKKKVRSKARTKPPEEKKPTRRGQGVRDGAGRFLPRDESGQQVIPRRNGRDSKPDYPDFPYLNARYYTTPDGQVIIDVDFSPSFVNQIDQKFADEPGWDQTLPGNAKVALFLYSIMEQAVEPYMSEEIVDPRPAADIMAEIPVMQIQGGPDQTQRVDISRMKSVGRLG
jgi:hypothetical protein